MTVTMTRIAILGASGLIGHAVAVELLRQGFDVVPVARRFAASQLSALNGRAFKWALVDAGTEDLARWLTEHRIDVVVNCIGVLQDSARGTAEHVHTGFVDRLIRASQQQPHPVLLIQVSTPGVEEADTTAFSRSKREAERRIRRSGCPFVILRPGFVVAQGAYGGSALVRAIASLPINLPAYESAQPFATVSMADISRTATIVVRRWQKGERDWSATWDVMDLAPTTLGAVIQGFRVRFGGPKPLLCLPSWLMLLGAKAGDLSARLGWQPPIRSTSLAEIRRGVSGNPKSWIQATGLNPETLQETLQNLHATVQEKWFARLYLIKAGIIFSLAIFWIASGLIALTFAFEPARQILLSHGFPPSFATIVTIVSSAFDILIGIAIAHRRTCRAGLICGVGLSLFYMLGAASITPELWLEPLGALVKTFPAIVLMLVAMAILDER